MSSPCLLDSDTLSELSQGNRSVTRNARTYLEEHGRLAFSAVTVLERLRGFRAALAAGQPYKSQLKAFHGLCQVSRVLPVDELVAERAAIYWSPCTGGCFKTTAFAIW